VSGWLRVAGPATVVVTRACGDYGRAVSRWANVTVMRALPQGVAWSESRPDSSLLCCGDVSKVPCFLGSTGNGLPRARREIQASHDR
jgi:hypothetical protein